MCSSRRIILIAVLCFLSSSLYAQERIAEYSGSGIKNTRPFSVSKSWEVDWNANGDIFQLYLYKSDGSLVGVVANQQGSGTGSSYQPQTGKFYFKVNAIGRWDIEITESADNTGSSGSSSGTIASFNGSGAKNTHPIIVNSPWELQWDSEGDIFQVYLYSKEGSLVSVIANQSQPGQGSSYQPQTGSYYFKVNALGDWSMKVVKAER